VPKETFFNLPEEKRQHLLDIAIDEFASNDYQNVSISRFVERAGIAKGSFYQYFEDKKDLYFYLLDMAAQDKMAFLTERRPPDPAMGLFAYLGWLFQVGVEFQFFRPRLAEVGYRALYTDAPFREELTRRLQQGAQAYYRQLIGHGIEQGDIDPNVEPDMAAYVLGALINEFGNYIMATLDWDVKAIVERGLNEKEQSELHELVEQFLYVLRNGIGIAK
jgi:TetR/AcrR family transcriptional regulator